MWKRSVSTLIVAICVSVGGTAVAQQTYKEIDPKSYDFANAPTYRKTARLAADKIQLADKEQEVVTVIAGKPETRNMAKPGDFIVTGVLGERYVIAGNRFDRLYEKDPANANEFRSKGTVQALLLTESVTFKAPWGEQQRIDVGGVLVKNGPDVYGIAAQAFAETYGRANRDGVVFVALDRPLAEQKQAAEKVGNADHVRDIAQRLSASR